MKYYLGIDAGGTKTHTIIVNENDQIVGSHTSGAGNPTSAGIDGALDNIFESIISAKLQAENNTNNHDISIVGSCIGIAGLDTEKDKQILSSLLEKLFYRIQLDAPVIVNDIQIGIRSATDSKNSMGLICGTGSNCYAQNENGEVVRVGGLEYILSDEASGYNMGHLALRYSAKSYDGRLKKTILEKLITNKLNVVNMREAKNIVMNYKKRDFGQLVPLVFDAAKQSDWAALEIVGSVINEGFLMVKTAVNKIKYNGTFDLVYIGGLFENELFSGQISEKISTEFPNAKIIFHDKSPAWGAIKIAKEHVNQS